MVDQLFWDWLQLGFPPTAGWAWATAFTYGVLALRKLRDHFAVEGGRMSSGRQSCRALDAFARLLAPRIAEIHGQHVDPPLARPLQGIVPSASPTERHGGARREERGRCSSG